MAALSRRDVGLIAEFADSCIYNLEYADRSDREGDLEMAAFFYENAEWCASRAFAIAQAAQVRA